MINRHTIVLLRVSTATPEDDVAAETSSRICCDAGIRRSSPMVRAKRSKSAANRVQFRRSAAHCVPGNGMPASATTGWLMMDIRLAVHADLDQLARMRWEQWSESGSHPAVQDEEAFVAGFIRDLESRLNKEWFVWCAVEDEMILSHVYVQVIQKVPKPSRPVDSFGYISNVYTRAGKRNCGICSRVTEQVKSWANAEKVEFLVLWPSRPSMPFWRRLGFSADDPLSLEIRPYVF